MRAGRELRALLAVAAIALVTLGAAARPRLSFTRLRTPSGSTQILGVGESAFIELAILGGLLLIALRLSARRRRAEVADDAAGRAPWWARVVASRPAFAVLAIAPLWLAVTAPPSRARRLDVETSLDQSRCFEGETVLLTARVTADAPVALQALLHLSPGVTTDDDLAVTSVDTQEAEFSWVLRGQRWGRWPVGPIEVRAHGEGTLKFPRLPAVRRAELAAGLLALALPVSQSPHALGLFGAGLVALVVVAIRPWAPARTAVGCAVVGNAFVFWPLQVVATSVVLWADAVALLCFLALGGWADTGASSAADLRAIACLEGRRLVLGAAVAGAVTGLTWAPAPTALSLVFAAMAAGVCALVLARRAAG